MAKLQLMQDWAADALLEPNPFALQRKVESCKGLSACEAFL
jgi:hypothetical protein